MLKTPCEIIVWNFLPALRRALIKAMVKDGVKRKEIAQIFDVTEATISHYLRSKRGTGFKFSKEVEKEIESAARRIVKARSKEKVLEEVCKLCSKLKKRRAFCNLHKRENTVLLHCKLYRRVKV